MRMELCWTLLMLVVRGRAEPAAPQNLNMVTLNTDYKIHWDWNQNSTDNVTFTVQYQSNYKHDGWTSLPLCKETRSRFCDLTQKKLLYKGGYVIRVQAIVGGFPSAWNSTKFCPDTDAFLGPPTSVHLSPVDGDLEVGIQAPLTSSNTSMKDEIESLAYHIMYWEHRDSQSIKTRRTPNTRVIIDELRPQTLYCVAVQSYEDSYVNKSSNFTRTQCISTGGTPPWWQIFLIFLMALLSIFLVLMVLSLFLYKCYRTIKSTWFPSVQLPDTLTQLLHDSSPSDSHHLLHLGVKSSLSCDQVSVCPELVIQDLPDLAVRVERASLHPESSNNESSRESGDSGVYSSENSVSIQQLSDYLGSSVVSRDYLEDQLKLKCLTPTGTTLQLRQCVDVI